MNTDKHHNVITGVARLLPAGLVAAMAMLVGTAVAKDVVGRASVIRPDEEFMGRSYGDLAASWQQWAIGLPALPGHPNFDDGNFDITDGQSGSVWFLAAPFGTVERSGTVPKKKALFIALLNAEVSNLESDPFFGATEADQRAQVKFLVDHVVNPFFIIDGRPLKKIWDYRVASPQYSFVAPDPNILGVPAGSGTSVTDGYWVLVEPMEKGTHTIRYGGAFHFSVAEGDPFDLDAVMDMTYHLTVE